MKAVVLSGGKGERLRPFTFSGPKQLIEIANKPLLFYVLEQIAEAGIIETAVISGEHLGIVRDTIGDPERFGLDIEYVFQTVPGGIAQAVGLTRDFVGEDKFLVVLGDNLLLEGLKPTVDMFNECSSNALVNLCEVGNPSAFGVAHFDKDMKLLGFIEKPKDPPSNLALVGVYAFDSSIWEQIANLKPSFRGELEITDAITGLVKSGKYVEYRTIVGDWLDTGKRDDWLIANMMMLDKIGVKTVIDPTAKVSHCTLGEYVTIGRHAIVENASLDNCIVLEGAEIRNCPTKICNSIIGRYAKVLGDNSVSMTLGDYSIVRVLECQKLLLPAVQDL